MRKPKPHPFRVVVVSENDTAAVRAQELSTRLASRLKGAFRLRCAHWNFAMLELEPMRDQAAKEAIVAEMVIISAQWAGDLPATVKRWAENWSSHKRGHFSALVALVNPKAAADLHPRPLCSYLRTLAEENGMDFFTNEECVASDRYSSAEAGFAHWREHRPSERRGGLQLHGASRAGGLYD